MEHNNSWPTLLARLIIRVTNPPILSVVTLLLIGITKSSDSLQKLGCVMVILLFFVVLPVSYLFFRTHNRNLFKSETELTLFLKKHPKDILILAFFLGLSSLGILWAFNAPTILIYTIATLITGSIVISVINIFYRASFHLMGITLLVVLASKAWGVNFLILLTAIPLIFWAKYYLHDHTIPQLLIGIAVATIILLLLLQVVGENSYFFSPMVWELIS